MSHPNSPLTFEGKRRPIARTPARGNFVVPEPLDEGVEITEAQMSIFDLLG